MGQARIGLGMGFDGAIMSQEPARFSFSLTHGTLEVSGSEEFVNHQVELFTESIRQALRSGPTGSVQAPAMRALPKPPENVDHQDVTLDKGNNPYPNVLDVMNGKVRITRSMKGRATSEKAMTLVMIYLWGREKLLGENTATFKELRDLCEEYGCLDPSNFSGTLNGKKSLLLVDGVKGSTLKECKLTYPGREFAEERLRELNEG